MECPYFRNGRCAVAELHAREELELNIECRPDDKACAACKAAGEPCEDRPSVACIGLVTSQLPKDKLPAWRKYVAWIRHGKSRGVGDTIAKVTKATGIDKVAKVVGNLTGNDCGCAKRQKLLNKMAPYSKQ